MPSAGRALVLGLLAGLAMPGFAAAQGTQDSQLGLGVGYSTRFKEPVLTVEFVVPLHDDFPADVVAGLQYLDDGDTRRYVAILDGQWRFSLRRLHRRAFGWVGGGFGLITEDPKGPREATTRDGQLSAFVGVGYDAPAVPYVQVRVTRKDEVILGLGVRF